MKRLITLVALLVFVLSACANSNPKSNTISAVELTEREHAILTTTSDKSFVFDFNTDSDYKEVSVWVEKYESGKLVNDAISSLLTEVEEKGSIIFATSNPDDSGKKQTFNIGIRGNGGISSVSNFETTSDDLDAMASVWNNLEGKSNSIEGELLLAIIGYSSNETMSSLSTGFYEDFEGNRKELEKYDVVYLLKAEFNK
ncbi:hypothetical protein [Sporosarcina sp. E16_8]|uniref:hypothetical protein n=1 Tax=Sporosarcina sp. E16_8 TaxID=2789295 RepID=UPI001A934362|nr:hypothetical protein [Sporosarcina sp. E16_8]MBO0586678.1 hypothetical protein [Sporosarcina sp. E16_8]